MATGFLFIGHENEKELGSRWCPSVCVDTFLLLIYKGRHDVTKNANTF